MPYLPSLPFFFAITCVTIGMISVVELVEVGASGIFRGEYWLSHPTGECTIAYFAREQKFTNGRPLKV